MIPGEIEKFVQFPNADSLNATLLHDQKGEKGVEELPFHHRMIIVRKQKAKIVQIAKDFG